MSKKLTTEEFIEKAKKKHGDLYDYSKVKYIKSNQKVIFICNRCHKEFLQLPNTHLVHGGCPECNYKEGMRNKIKRYAKRFIEKASILHNNKYDYSLVEYKNSKLPVTIICKKCGHVFKQLPNNHLHGEGCPNCFGNVPLTKEKFIQLAQKVHGCKYNYSEIIYTNNRTPMKIKCNKCGKIFYQDSGNHLSGQGCPYCVVSKGEMKIGEFLDKYNIKYEQQKVFKECKDKRALPFDFYLVDYNLCIEFNGKQHYKEGFSFYMSYNKGNHVKAQEQFNKTKLHDQIRKNYCVQNNIKLLEIRYDEDIEKVLTKVLGLGNE